MDRCTQWIASLADYKTRPNARKNLIELGADRAGQPLLDYLGGEDVEENALWAAASILKTPFVAISSPSSNPSLTT